jgi:two-component system, OmpR family, response regulator
VVNAQDFPGAIDQLGQRRPILIMDDDPSMQNTIVPYLEEHGMLAVRASTPQEAVRHFLGSMSSLVILNLQTDQQGGLDLLRQVRSRSEVPVIIILTDPRSELDRVVGLELGADDCITRPFGLRELLARIRAILRRHSGRRDPDRRCYRFGGWQLDQRTRRLTGPDGTRVPLTNGGYALLVAFLAAPQRPLSREQILQATRKHEDVFDRSIDVQVLRLRRKLEIDPNTPRVIQTERGFGYMFTLPVEQT